LYTISGFLQDHQERILHGQRTWLSVKFSVRLPIPAMPVNGTVDSFGSVVGGKGGLRRGALCGGADKNRSNSIEQRRGTGSRQFYSNTIIHDQCLDGFNLRAPPGCNRENALERK
jgi:hypothetical protein